MALAGRLAWLLVVVASGTGVARAQEAREPTDAVLELTVNAAPRGELLVRLDDDEIWADVAGLERAGLVGFGGTRVTRGTRTFVLLSSIEPRPAVTVDERALSIAIVADVSLLPRTVVAIGRHRPDGIVYTRTASAFLNYGASWTSSSSQGGLNLESGVSAGPALFTSSLFLAGGQRTARGLTSITLDDRDSLRRWVVGDAVVATGPLGGSLQVAGISVSRDFSIDPYFVRYPTAALSGVVTTPSRVELYVNDQLVRTLQLPPGQYELSDLALPAGNAETRVVVRDAFGGEQELAGSYYVTTSVLAKGLHQYYYAIGSERLRPFEELWTYGRPVATALHRVGISDTVTIGGRAEADAGLFSGGPNLAARLGRFGSLELSLAASRVGGHTGVGLSAAYEYTADRGSLGIAWRQATASYATLSTRRGARAMRSEVFASARVRVLARGAVGVNWQQQALHDAVGSTRAGVTSTFSVSPRVNAFATLARTRTESYGWFTSAQAGVTMGLATRGSSSVSYDHAETGGRMLADIHRAAPVGPGIGYRLQAAGPASGTALSAELRAQTRWAQADVHHSAVTGGFYGQVNGALVAIGGRVLATRPVHNGFALVRVPEVSGVRTFVSHQEVGRTDRHGDLLVTNLLPYYGNRISIADADVPVDRTVEANGLLLAPPYRGGAIAAFGVSRDWRVAGRVVVNADPLALRGQRAVDARLVISTTDGVVESALGLDGDFYLEGLPPGTYDGDVRYAQGTCAIRIVVPESDAPVIRVGAVACRPAGEADR